MKLRDVLMGSYRRCMTFPATSISSAFSSSRARMASSVRAGRAILSGSSPMARQRSHERRMIDRTTPGFTLSPR